MPIPEPEILVLENVSKTFRSGRGEVAALREVELRLRPGVSLAVTGRSGSGKSTLLQVAAGLEAPTTGRVVCLGVDLGRLSRRQLCLFLRQGVGFLFQRGNLLSALTVHENIAFPLALNGVGDAERKRRVEELLERVGLTGAAQARPSELSGGEAQRVAAARAVAHRPRLILADEPTANLDSVTGRALMELLLDLGRRDGCAILVVAHDPAVIDLLDERLEMLDGRIISESA